MIRHSAYALGATLYMPATRPDILDVVFGERFKVALIGELSGRRCRRNRRATGTDQLEEPVAGN